MRQKSRKPLKESNLKLRLALRAAQIGIWDWDIASSEMQYSRRARSIFGFKPDELITLDKVRATTHPDDLRRTSAMARRALDPVVKSKDTYEYRIIRADTREVRWVTAHGEAVFAKDGKGGKRAIRYIGTVQDITDRRNTEDALRTSELRQSLAIEAARLAVWELDLASDRVTLSRELNQMFGFKPDAKPSMDDFRAAYAPGEREKTQRAGEKALAEGKNNFEAEFKCRWPDGSLHWLLLRAEVLFGPNRTPERVIGVLIDIDERKRREEQQVTLLRELNHRVKNSLSVVQSLATQTFRGGKADPQSVQAFRNRLKALAIANDAIVDHDWQEFELSGMLDAVIAPYCDPPDRICTHGPKIVLPPGINVSLALTLHELCTNAAKYGALSVADGTVSIGWRRKGRDVEIVWTETGGPPIASAPIYGFGLNLIANILAVDLGEVEITSPAAGFICRITLRL